MEGPKVSMEGLNIPRRIQIVHGEGELFHGGSKIFHGGVKYSTEGLHIPRRG